MPVTKTFFYVAIVLGLVPVLLLNLKKRNHTDEISYIVPFAWVTFIAALYEGIATYFSGINPFFWFRLYLFMEFYALFYFFFRLMKMRFRPVFVFFAVLFLISFIGLFFVGRAISDFSTELKMESYLSLIEITFVFVFSFVWFKNIFTNLTSDSLLSDPVFFFISGLIIYFSGTFFLFLLSSYIFKSEKLILMDYWPVISIAMTIFLRLFLIIGIWKRQTK